MQKPDRYDIPFTVKAQVIKSDQVREGLRCVRTKKVDKSESITQDICTDQGKFTQSDLALCIAAIERIAGGCV